MISTRSRNTEYVNSANPFGYHLGQGTLYSYVNGYEYRDIQDTWDWDLIPGTTVLLDPPMIDSSKIGVMGAKSFVGSVSDGSAGMSVMDYVDPQGASLSYRKLWFFADDSILVTTSNVTVFTGNNISPTTPPVINVLDQRLASPDGIYVDGLSVNAGTDLTKMGSTLFYGGNAYLSYDTPFNLTLSESNRTGNWSAISTSMKENTTVPIFSAYTTIPIGTSSYTFFPASNPERLRTEVVNPTIKPFEMNGTLGATSSTRLALVFWPGNGLDATVPISTIGWGSKGDLAISSSDPAAFLFSSVANQSGSNTRTVTITVADPTQLLTTIVFSLSVSEGSSMACPDMIETGGCVSQGNGVTLNISLPIGGMAGSSISRNVTYSLSITGSQTQTSNGHLRSDIYGHLRRDIYGQLRRVIYAWRR